MEKKLEGREAQMNIRLFTEDKERIEAAAYSIRLRPSAFVRQAALEKVAALESTPKKGRTK